MKFSTELLPTTPNYFQSSLQKKKWPCQNRTRCFSFCTHLNGILCSTSIFSPEGRIILINNANWQSFFSFLKASYFRQKCIFQTPKMYCIFQGKNECICCLAPFQFWLWTFVCFTYSHTRIELSFSLKNERETTGETLHRSFFSTAPRGSIVSKVLHLHTPPFFIRPILTSTERPWCVHQTKSFVHIKWEMMTVPRFEKEGVF